ncbi:hypothetical protein [Falsiroseomonas sp. E2-1-a20]|uniref:hypothetical protein n=1 Tax=Falsiroseomonas sp. E2-1-a20 TaxID=3239300 RepID=UPI003F2FD9B3
MMREFRRGPSTALMLVAGAMLGLGTAGGVAAQDRSQDGGDRQAQSPFEAGFRAGLADERRRGDPASLGPHWNDAFQGEAMERLDLARILLRQVLVTLRQAPPGDQRDRALEQARQALVRTQNAMTWLPRDGDRRARRAPPLAHGWGERASGGPEG